MMLDGIGDQVLLPLRIKVSKVLQFLGKGNITFFITIIDFYNKILKFHKYADGL